jgi:predicted PurR-regulated permease PerM
MNRKSGSNQTAELLRIVTAVVVVAALYVGRTVFIPLALALLLSLLLAPVMGFLSRLRVPRLLAVLLVVIALCCVAGGLAWKASAEFTDLANQLPIYKDTLETKIRTLRLLRNSNFSKVSDAVSDLEKELEGTWARLVVRPGEAARHESCGVQSAEEHLAERRTNSGLDFRGGYIVWDY